MRLRWSLIIAAVVAGFAVSACGGSATTGSADDVNWIQYQPQGPGGDNAQITGEIVEVDGCLAVHNPELGDEAVLLAFSSESSRPASLQIGQDFVGAGGHVPVGSIDADSGWTFPDSCSDASVVWIVNAE